MMLYLRCRCNCDGRRLFCDGEIGSNAKQIDGGKADKMFRLYMGINSTLPSVIPGVPIPKEGVRLPATTHHPPFVSPLHSHHSLLFSLSPLIHHKITTSCCHCVPSQLSPPPLVSPSLLRHLTAMDEETTRTNSAYEEHFWLYIRQIAISEKHDFLDAEKDLIAAEDVFEAERENHKSARDAIKNAIQNTMLKRLTLSR